MEFASSAIGSKGGMKIYILYGVYGYPHDGSHPALLFYGLVTSTDEYIWPCYPSYDFALFWSGNIAG